MSKADLRLDWCSHKAAKYACERWHYSGTLPAGKLIKIGVWEGGKFIGVLLFGRGTCGHLWDRYGLDQTQGCELVRVALTKHKTEVSRIIAVSLRMLRTTVNGIRLIVSFADKGQYHHGGIYQASNWIYTGETQYKQRFSYQGKDVTDRTIGSLMMKLRETRRSLKKKGLIKEIKTFTKHRYLMPLDDEMKKQIASLAKPYPKRTKQAMTETIGTAAGQNRPVRSIEAV